MEAQLAIRMRAVKPLSLVLMAILGIGPVGHAQSPRPNIVWLVSEDNSKHYLRLYEETGSAMTSVEALAEQGIVFNHAFSQGPVCSVARSTIITGCYAPRIGAQYHRKMALAPMPTDLHMFPHYLRKAGYYTSNNSKEDYNLVKSPEAWDESSRQATYRNRRLDQPFFHVQNFGTTHEGQLHFSEEEMAETATETPMDRVSPFPYHPQTAAVRYTNARYADLHKKLDDQLTAFFAPTGSRRTDGQHDHLLLR